MEWTQLTIPAEGAYTRIELVLVAVNHSDLHIQMTAYDGEDETVALLGWPYRRIVDLRTEVLLAADRIQQLIEQRHSPFPE